MGAATSPMVTRGRADFGQALAADLKLAARNRRLGRDLEICGRALESFLDAISNFKSHSNLESLVKMQTVE